MNPIFAPTLMCLDYLDVKNQINTLNKYCDMYHADIMDGHFAKNITFSADFVRAIHSIAKLPLDVHLMVEKPNDFVDIFAEVGIEYITLHAETIQTYSNRIIRKIKDLGCKVGVAVCPATPLSAVEWYLSDIDILTIMTVEVGYAGQKFIPQMVGKVEQAKRLKEEKGYHYIIQCDGAIGKDNYKSLFDAGAQAFVMGTSGLFKPGITLDEACKKMKREFSQATGVPL
ncbi:MAG: D-allulose 6-phosphate 3-epimerase [Anaerolineaceae bacterium]